MTGLAPDTTRIYDLKTHFREFIPNVVTIGQAFKRNGYFSARVGKIYHAGNPGSIGTSGLDDAPTWDYIYNPNGIDHTQEESRVTDYTPKRGLGSAMAFFESPVRDNQTTDGIGAEHVSLLLDKYRDQPFFIGAGFFRPHVPWITPKKYFDRFPLEQIHAYPFDPGELHIAPPPAYFTHPANFGMNIDQRRHCIQAYYASISYLDSQVGKVLDALEHNNLLRNTTIVFWSDHGYQLGEHGQWMKQTLFEKAARVPLIIAGAGVEARGTVCHRTVEHLDIYPTLAEICGLNNIPEGLHGTSLVPLLKAPNSNWDKPAVSQLERPPTETPALSGYSLRTECYRYTAWQDGYAGEELYDYESDPRELNNLANDSKFDMLRKQLRTQLEAISVTRGKHVSRAT